ncbi:MAG: glycoside hydrolase family 2 TIM barrel-domain containing protein [Planctomycetota bacterium]
MGLICLLLACAMCVGVAAQPNDQIVNAHQRKGIDLNGDWPIVIDPYDNGTFDYLSRPHTRNGFWTSAGPQGPTDQQEWSFTEAETLAVPGDWNSQRDDLFFYEGTVWYRRTFDLAPEAERRYFLCIAAANKRSKVWVNGTEVGQHAVGFTPVHLEVTDQLVSGENSVTVRVNNERRFEAVPGLNTDWWNYGGITRDVRLVSVPSTFIRDADIIFEGETITATIALDGPEAVGQRVSVSIDELGIDAEGVTGETGTATISMVAPESLRRWGPESPVLYDVSFASRADAVHDRVGFRTIETRGSEILLNGEPVFLRGICIHEEAISREGRAWSEADARELLTLAKELGCNYVRLAHYPHNEHMLRVADEMGLLVWAEIPVYWTLDFANPATLAEAKSHLTGMIDRDMNRASVIIWSIGNETGDEAERTVFRNKLGEHVKLLDDSRLLSAAMFAKADVTDGKPTRLRVVDPFGEMADVLAINTYVGWYWAQAEDLRSCTVERKWDKPLLISEFGAGVKHGLRGEPTDRWTEDFGVRLYTETLAWADRIEGLAGLSPWILKDFRSPRRQLTGVQDWYNRKGMVSETGERKMVFDVLRRYYEQKSGERSE